MRKLLILAIVLAGIGTIACGGLFDSDPCPNGVECGDGCCNDGKYCTTDHMCATGGGGGGGGTDLYVSANGCKSGNIYSYRGSSTTVCYSYYNAARADSCTKILWKC
jgi:hypothetical protein